MDLRNFAISRSSSPVELWSLIPLYLISNFVELIPNIYIYIYIAIFEMKIPTFFQHSSFYIIFSTVFIRKKIQGQVGHVHPLRVVTGLVGKRRQVRCERGL